jgi:hypothetical protein
MKHLRRIRGRDTIRYSKNAAVHRVLQGKKKSARFDGEQMVPTDQVHVAESPLLPSWWRALAGRSPPATVQVDALLIHTHFLKDIFTIPDGCAFGISSIYQG